MDSWKTIIANDKNAHEWMDSDSSDSDDDEDSDDSSDVDDSDECSSDNMDTD